VINQKALTDLAPTIKLEEAAVLDFLIHICTSSHKKIVEQRQEGYTWVNYSHLIKQMPLLRGKTPSALSPKIDRLKQLGFISTWLDPETRKKYIQLEKKSQQLMIYEDEEVNEECFYLLLTLGLDVKQAKEIASNAYFLQENERAIKNAHNRDNPAGYVWAAYDHWNNGYVKSKSLEEIEPLKEIDTSQSS
jgi:DNA-binding MarR family transcriptional regulator